MPAGGRGNTASAAPVDYECDACMYAVSGYSKKELLTEGWRWEDAKKGRLFVMCGDCVEKFTPLWEAKAAA